MAPAPWARVLTLALTLIAVAGVPDLRALAWQASPDVARAEAELAAAEGELTSRRVLLPNPELEASLNSDVVFANQGEFDVDIALVQQLVWPGTRGARVDAAEQRVKAARLRLALARLRVAADVEAALGALAAANDARAVRDAIAVSARALAEAARRQVEAGAIGDLEATLAKSDEALADAALATATAERDAALAALCGVIGREECTDLDVSWPALTALDGATMNMEVLAAGADVDAAARDLDAAELTRIPDARLGLGYALERSVLDAPFLPDVVDDPDHLLGVTLSVTLPVWDWKTGDVKRARAEAARAEADRRAAVLRAKSTVSATLSRFRAASDAEARLNAVADDVHRALGDIERAYVAGGLSLPEALATRDRLLRMRVELVDAKKRKVDAHADALRALADPGVIGIEVTP